MGAGAATRRQASRGQRGLVRSSLASPTSASAKLLPASSRACAWACVLRRVGAGPAAPGHCAARGVAVEPHRFPCCACARLPSVAGDTSGVIIIFSIGTAAVMLIGALQLFVEYSGSKVTRTSTGADSVHSHATLMRRGTALHTVAQASRGPRAREVLPRQARILAQQRGRACGQRGPAYHPGVRCA